jgi:sporulation protein YpjB
MSVFHSIRNKQTRKKWTVLLTAAVLFWFMGQSVFFAAALAEESNEAAERMKPIDECAESMYRHIQAGDIEAARLELTRLERLVTETSFQGITGIEGLEALTSAIVEAKRAFHAVRPSEGAALAAAAAVRLATDALTHRHNPLWLRYESILADDLVKLRNAYQLTDRQGVDKSLEQLERHYALVRPAALISREPHLIEKIDSLFTFIRGKAAAEGPRDKALLSGFVQLTSAFDELFQPQDRPALLMLLPLDNPWYWSLIFSLIILSVLIYWGWFRYRLERDYVLVKRNGGGGY